MQVKYIVANDNEKPKGYVLDDGNFYTIHTIRENINLIDNISVLNNGEFSVDSTVETVAYSTIMQNKYENLLAENPFVRDIQKDLVEWKLDSSHKVLQLEGSRQIGKTTELLKFGYKNYDYVIYVNLANDIYGFRNIVAHGISALSMTRYCLDAGLPEYVNNQNTLLIIDEIQVEKLVYNSIRALNNELKCDIVVTGSYLGQTIKDDFFLPAGTVSILTMYPLSFAEYCRVFNKEVLLVELDVHGSSPKESYTQLATLYNEYREIGGYPSVIKDFKLNRDIDRCREIISDLLNIFEKESRNYFSGTKETLIFRTVYTQAVLEMCSEKKGSGSKLVDKVTTLVKDSQKMLVSRDEVSKAINWLVYSGILGECNLCSEGDILAIQPARRLYYVDCGIASYVASQMGLPDSDVKGLITETFAYSELLRLYTAKYTKKKVSGDIPCFSTSGTYELDFMVLGADGTKYGIEVKTNDGDCKSLKYYIARKYVDKGVLAKLTQGGKGEVFNTIPIYAIGSKFPYM